MKQEVPEPDLVSLSVRVKRETAERLKEIADRNDRPVAAQIRRLIQSCVDEDRESNGDDAPVEAAA